MADPKIQMPKTPPPKIPPPEIPEPKAAGPVSSGPALAGAEGPDEAAAGAARTLDLVGLKCPLPAMLTRRALAAMAPGARLVVRASDPLAAIDLPHLCTEDGHRLISLTRDAAGVVVEIERGVDGRGRDCGGAASAG